jgi:hypothetical protein
MPVQTRSQTKAYKASLNNPLNYPLIYPLIYSKDTPLITRELITIAPKPIRPIVTCLTTEQLVERNLVPNNYVASIKYPTVIRMLDVGNKSKGYDVVGSGIWGLTPPGYYWKLHCQNSYHWLDWYAPEPIPNDC